MIYFRNVRVLNIPGLSVCPGFWISRVMQGLYTNFCKYDKDSKYLSRYNYGRVLNITGLSVCPGFWISRVTQGLPIFVNMAGFWISIKLQLDITGFWICQISAYASIIQGCWIWVSNVWIKCSDYGSIMNIPGQSFTGFEHASGSKYAKGL